MSLDDRSLSIHEQIFRLRCYEKRMSEFQSFFEKIMFKLDSSFISVKPSGREGDWKCDGFSKITGTVYQCYSPEDLSNKKTVASAAKKVREDFEGAKIHWDADMKYWVFVWSAHVQLPPQVLKELLQIKKDNTKIIIEDWSREVLWQKVSQLSKELRESILEFSLELETASETTAAEVETLLTFLTKKEFNPLETDLELTNLQDKLDKNNLSNDIQVLVRHTIPIAKIVGDYTRNHPDTDYSGIVAKVLSDKYDSLVDEGVINADSIFFALVSLVSSNKMNQPKFFYASIGIVSHYFELCDIFER